MSSINCLGLKPFGISVVQHLVSSPYLTYLVSLDGRKLCHIFLPGTWTDLFSASSSSHPLPAYEHPIMGLRRAINVPHQTRGPLIDGPELISSFILLCAQSSEWATNYCLFCAQILQGCMSFLPSLLVTDINGALIHWQSRASNSSCELVYMTVRDDKPHLILQCFHFSAKSDSSIADSTCMSFFLLYLLFVLCPQDRPYSSRHSMFTLQSLRDYLNASRDFWPSSSYLQRLCWPLFSVVTEFTMTSLDCWIMTAVLYWIFQFPMMMKFQTGLPEL